MMKQSMMFRGASLSAIYILVILVSLKVIFQVNAITLQRSWWTALITTSALAGSLYLGFDRNTWLPFLGEGIVPYTLLRKGTPSDATIGVKVTTDTNAVMCMYWASSSKSAVTDDPWTAYAGFANAGVVEVENGTALLLLDCPGQYKVPRKSKPLPKHVHYRWIYENGMASDVQTQNIEC